MRKLGPALRRGRSSALVGVGVLLLATVAAPAQQKAAPPDEFKRRIDIFARALGLVRDRHILKPDEKLLLDGAVRGMLAALDADAEYLDAEAFARRTVQSGPASGGASIGLELRKEQPVRRGSPGGARVVASLDGSAAARAGIQPMDLITHIDGEPVGDTLLGETEKQLAAATGGVALTVVRKGVTEPLDVLLPAGAADIASASELLAGNILYVRLASLDERTPAVLAAAAGQAKVALGGAAPGGVVLDLRNTATADIAAAVPLADAFLDEGAILVTRTRDAEKTVAARATSGDIAAGMPLVVLINEGTAMAAEVAAAALKGNGRARLVGTKSFGRAAAQSVLALGSPPGSKGAIILTTARYLTPGGAAIDGRGLVPDVVVEQARRDPGCRTTDTRDSADAACLPRGPGEDTQLLRAIEMLRGGASASTAPGDATKQ